MGLNGGVQPCCDGGNDVGDNIVFCAFLGEGFSEADHAEFGGRVVCLAKRAVKTGGGGSVDDPSVLLFSENGPARLGGLIIRTQLL